MTLPQTCLQGITARLACRGPPSPCLRVARRPASAPRRARPHAGCRELGTTAEGGEGRPGLAGRRWGSGTAMGAGDIGSWRASWR